MNSSRLERRLTMQHGLFSPLVRHVVRIKPLGSEEACKQLCGSQESRMHHFGPSRVDAYGLKLHCCT